MLRLLIDQNILRGLLRRIPDLDTVTAHEIGLSTASDPVLLAWAADHGRILVTHDRKTMPSYAIERVVASEPMPGVYVIPRRLPIAQVIEELEMMVLCSHDNEWDNIVKFFPL